MCSSPITERAPFDELLGLEIQAVEDGAMEGVVPVRPALTQPLGMVHGGVYAAVAEALASLGTNRAVGSRDSVALGQSNSCSFLRPITEGQVHALARPRHRGISTWVWDVEMSDDAGRLCALSRVTVAVRHQRPR